MLNENMEIKRLKKNLKKVNDDFKQWADDMLKYINNELEKDGGVSTQDAGPGDVPPPPPPRK